MKTAEKVFTPRSANVNDKMYIVRSDIENALISGFKGTMHIIIHGDSGSGKSWLYKKVFKDNKIFYLPANLANASRFKSIDKEFENLLNRENRKVKDSYTSSSTVTAESEFGFSSAITFLSAKIKGIFSSSEQTHYKITSKEPFEACLEYLNKRAKRKPAVLVLDNFESILDNDILVKELSDIIILLDDERYGRYNVKLLIVGTPNDILYYFKKISSNNPVVNRVTEIPEVSRLTDSQTFELVERGFIIELGFKFEDEVKAKKHIAWITDRIPQRIQEYCLILANLAIADKKIDSTKIDLADKKWLKDSLSSNYSAIENVMNSRETSVGRRNQTLYSIGQIQNNELRISEVGEVIRRIFPNSTGSVAINVSAMLTELEKADPPILKRSPKGDAYYFVDSKYKMCIRAMLFLEEEIIRKKAISNI